MSQDIYNNIQFSIQDDQIVFNRFRDDSVSIQFSQIKKITIHKDFTNSFGHLVLFLSISLCTFFIIYLFSEINKLGGLNEVFNKRLFFEGRLNTLNAPLWGIAIIGFSAPNFLKRRIIGVVNTDQNTYRLVFNEKNHTDKIDLVLNHLKGKLSDDQISILLT